jgi:acyl-CoA thioester hydrolase
MDYLLVRGGFDVLDGPVVPFTAENSCRYYRAVTFPEVVEVGLRVTRLGGSSVRYALGIFCQGDELIRAGGTFVDVFVSIVDSRPTLIPANIRAHLARLLVDADG